MPSTSALFGEVLAEFRQRAGFSQEGLADRAGVHRTYVSQLERGLKSPTLDVLLRLASALGIQPSRLLIAMEQRIADLPSS